VVPALLPLDLRPLDLVAPALLPLDLLPLDLLAPRLLGLDLLALDFGALDLLVPRLLGLDLLVLDLGVLDFAAVDLLALASLALAFVAPDLLALDFVALDLLVLDWSVAPVARLEREPPFGAEPLPPADLRPREPLESDPFFEDRWPDVRRPVSRWLSTAISPPCAAFRIPARLHHVATRPGQALSTLPLRQSLYTPISPRATKTDACLVTL